MKDLIKYIVGVHAATGRFDQKPIDDSHPRPSGLTHPESLMIVGAVCYNFSKDPTLVSHILPNESGAYLPSGMGTPWSEIENMTLAHEMHIIVKHAYEIKEECANANISPSKRIGELRRGIFAKMSQTLNEKYGMDRSEAACKNQWYRELRERTHVDERLAFDCSGKTVISGRMSVSLNVSTKSPSKSKALNDTPSKPKGITKRTSPAKQKRSIQAKLNFAIAKSNNQISVKHDEMFDQDDFHVQAHQLQPYYYENIPDLPVQPWEVEPQFHHTSYSYDNFAYYSSSNVVESIETPAFPNADTWVPPTLEELASVDQAQFEIDPSILAP
jgi:hypothetical protein